MPAENTPVERIRSEGEQERIQKRLLTRGNTLGGVVAAALKIIRHGGEVEPEQLERLENDLRSWTADVRSVAAEEMP